MDDRQRAELERIRKLQAQAGATPQLPPQVQKQVAEVSRALSQQALEAAEVSKKMNPVVRRVGEMYSAEVRRMMPQLTQMAREVAAAQVERAQPQIQEFLAAYRSQVVEISRQLQRAAAAQIASASIPRVEIFRPTLDRLVTQMDVAFPPYPAPAPAGEIAAPVPQQGGASLAQDRLELFISDVAVRRLAQLIVFLTIMAVLWQALTGQWRFEDLLDHLSPQQVEQVEQVEQSGPPIAPSTDK